MNLLAETLNFFGNPTLDRHRLLQGKWDPVRIHHYEGDEVSDNPLEHLLYILAENLHDHQNLKLPAVLALISFVRAAENNFTESSFTNIRREFWRGFQFVAACAAKELAMEFKDISREDVRKIILAST